MIGIDFGTAYTRAAWVNPRTGFAEPLPNPDGKLRTPSAVSFGDGEVCVGMSALRMPVTERSGVVVGVKRLLGQTTALPLPDRKLDPAGVVAEILRRVVADAAATLGGAVRQAVLTHPADFTPVELAALWDAAKLAGLEDVSLLPEPLAAAAGYEEAGGPAGNTVLVCDFGASRFTATPLVRTEDGQFRPAAPAQSRRVGGDDFDRLLLERCRQVALKDRDQALDAGAGDLAGRLAARDCKEECSRRERAGFAGQLTDSTPFRWLLDRPTFEELIRAEVEVLAKLARVAYDEAANRRSTVDTVLLLGGSARIPLFRQLLAAALPAEPVLWPQRDVAVALGAARAAQTQWSGPAPGRRVRVERNTTLSELIHRVSEREEKEKARMATENERRRDGTRKRVLDLFAVKSAALDREYDRLRGVLADRMAHQDFGQAQDAVCALRKIRTDDPEVVKAQAFIDTHFEKIGEVRSIPVGAVAYGVAATAEKHLGYIGTAGNVVGVYDLTAGTLVKNMSGHSNHPTSVTLARHAPRIASGSHDATIRIWSTDEFNQVASWNHGCVVRSVAYLTDGRHLTAAGDDSKVRLWDTEATDTPLNTFEGHTAIVYAVHPSPDGKHLASASKDGTVRVWDIGRGREARKLTGHRGEVFCVRFFPGGRLVVSGGADGTLRVWDTDNGREVSRWEGHESAVYCVDFTPDGRYAVSGSADKSVRVWDVASGWELRKFSGLPSAIRCVVVTADGKRAVTGGDDNTARIWSLGLSD